MLNTPSLFVTVVVVVVDVVVDAVDVAVVVVVVVVPVVAATVCFKTKHSTTTNTTNANALIPFSFSFSFCCVKWLSSFGLPLAWQALCYFEPCGLFLDILLLPLLFQTDGELAEETKNKNKKKERHVIGM